MNSFTDSLLESAQFTPLSLQAPGAWCGHLPFADWLTRTVQPDLFVELGTHSGNSYFAFCQTVREAGLSTRCYAVDTWRGDDHAGRYGDDVFEKVHAHNRAHYADFSNLLRMTFDEALGYFADGSIDLLHIDGLHTYEAVKHDFDSWRPKLAPGAVVLFHDTNVREHGFGVWKLWHELQARYPGHLEFTHSHGLGVVQVDGAEARPLPWLDPASPAQRQLQRYFAALGALQRERFERNQAQSRLSALTQTLTERDEQLAELHRALSDRDLQIAGLQHAVKDFDGRIAALDQARLDRDGQIAAFNQAVAERDGQIAGLNLAVAERNHRMAGLDQALAERDGQIAGLRQALAERDNQLHAIQGSLSWRLTAPLHAVLASSPGLSRFLRRTMKLIWWTLTFQLFRRWRERRAALHLELPPVIPHFAPAAGDYSVAVPFSYDLVSWETPPRLAVICHMFYPDMADEFKGYFSNIPFGFDLYITTDSDAKKSSIQQSFSGWNKGKVDVRLAQNRGRDIAPKLITCRDVYHRYEFVLHVHTKKSLNWGDAHGWRTYLLETLMGSSAIVESVFEAFRLDPKLGMIAPQHIEMIRQYLGKDSNTGNAELFARRLGITLTHDKTIDFPSGSMFWARSAALKPLLDLKLSFKDFPEELGQVDGTLGHLIERMYFAICEKAGFRWLKISLPAWHVDFNRFDIDEKLLADAKDPALDFDEAFYLQATPEVAHAVAQGVMPSGYYHYCLFGQFEGRVWRDRRHKLGFSQSSDQLVLIQNPDDMQALIAKRANPPKTPSGQTDAARLDGQESLYRQAYEKSAYRDALEFSRFVHEVNRLAANKKSLIDFDEAFYLQANPGVAQSVAQGRFPCGYVHYCLFGQFEGRACRDHKHKLAAMQTAAKAAPSARSEQKEKLYRKAYEQSDYKDTLDFARFAEEVDRLASRQDSLIDFDEEAYLQANPDIAKSVAQGIIANGYVHYCVFGQKEGRFRNQEERSAYLLKQKENFYRKAYEKSSYKDTLDFARFTEEVDRLAANEDSLIDFDEAFYLQANPDVVQSIAKGIVANGYIHYCLFGRFEGRIHTEQEWQAHLLKQKESFYRRAYEKSAYKDTLDFARFSAEVDRLAANEDSLIEFDEAFYLKVNPDVAQLIAKGTLPNGYVHFCLFGESEKRISTEQEWQAYLDTQKENLYREAYEKSDYNTTLDLTRFIEEVERLVENKASLIEFDEKFYLQANPDVAQLMKQGTLPNGYVHYCLCGQFEKRVWSNYEIMRRFGQAPRLSKGFTRPANLRPAPIYKPDLSALPRSKDPFLLIFFSHLQEDLFFAGYTEFFRDFKPIIDSFDRVVLSVECDTFNPELAARFSDRIEVIHESKLNTLECRPTVIVSFNSELFLKARDIFQDLDRTIYYCQDYEAGFGPLGTGYVRSEQAVASSRNIIVSTSLLYRFLKDKRLLTDSQHIWITTPKIEPVSVRPEKTRRLFFYFRPESFQSRNLPEILMGAAEQFCDKYTGYEIYMMGTIDTCYSYRINGNSIFVNSKVAKEEYVGLLSSCDLVVSMIYSAHPGVIAFQAAASGIPTVTNIFENRDAELLRSISGNLVPYDPVRENLLDRIELALTLPKGQPSFNGNLYGPADSTTISRYVEAMVKNG
ncbi:rhamnosyltransferase WsaF family glycosyltransferase [Methylosarcina fibrata]|uniref:rhamnosyltransferase WsaF family glycosyltransferase n=1 Tax=Methylosarcina fibrata TaxID=105972 RepID=UPI0003612A90|nr:rhamnan synthesis F family protein [Methylosarcina fibrata]